MTSAAKAIPKPGVGLPPSAPGMRIGLFGGSFNPPHEGHRLVAEQALKRLGLDALWWLVSPANPLKDRRALAPLDERIIAARTLATHPRMAVTGFETERGFAYSHQTLSFLTTSLPDRRFVWIMGADSLAGFHHWQRWEDIFRLLPIAVYARPGAFAAAIASRAATRFASARIDETDAPVLAARQPPAWVFLTGLTSMHSSTQLRQVRHDRA